MSRLGVLNLLLVFASLLTACTSAAVPLMERLGLPDDQPAFVFFYTDN